MVPGFRNFLNEILLTHAWYRSRSQQRESERVFANIAHELNSLFEKHFESIQPRIVRAGMHDVAHAWDVVRAVARIGSLYGKSRLADNEPDDQAKARSLDEQRSRFVGPIVALEGKNLLLDALAAVARLVASQEAPSSGDVSRRGGVVFAGDMLQLRVGDLTPDQMATCYFLVAEPLRNHIKYGRDKHATWNVNRTASGGIKIALKALSPPLAVSPPKSVTYETLNSLLQMISRQDGSRALCRREDGLDVWEVILERPLLQTSALEVKTYV